ncbi:MAG TPA: CapA family protein [Candidatus Limnocylindrales bacterium]|nr:CapA family protein [Candidatus Limnocylindrales bacterium]
MVRVALAGDTMLGRGVGERLLEVGPKGLFTRGVLDAVADADLFLLNLECCVSERGVPWARLGKPFFFRAPPLAVRTLEWLGVDCVTLANNHALDYGPVALTDTLHLLRDAGIECVGAGPDLDQARAVAVFGAGGLRVAVVGVTDHPADFAAGPDTPGVAFVDFSSGVPGWLLETIQTLDADVVIVTVHWGPNMTTEPLGYIRSAARELVSAGATLVAGHSAHVFHGVSGNVVFDLGDFVDDYAVDRVLRNDLGVLMLATLDGGGLRRLEAVPIALDFCFTRLAQNDEYAWVRERLTRACAAFGTEVADTGERLVITS